MASALTENDLDLHGNRVASPSGLVVPRPWPEPTASRLVPLPSPKPSRSSGSAPADTILFAAICTQQAAISIPVVAFARFCASLTTPGHALASRRDQHRGATMGTVSLSEAASRDVRMLRRTMGPAVTSNPKGNLHEENQRPNCCDDLARCGRADCRRMLSDHQWSDGQCQQAFHRHALVLSRSTSCSGMRRRRLSEERPQQAHCHHRRPCPIASPRSARSRPFIAWARLSQEKGP